MLACFSRLEYQGYRFRDWRKLQGIMVDVMIWSGEQCGTLRYMKSWRFKRLIDWRCGSAALRERRRYSASLAVLLLRVAATSFKATSKALERHLQQIADLWSIILKFRITFTAFACLKIIASTGLKQVLQRTDVTGR